MFHEVSFDINLNKPFALDKTTVELSVGAVFILGQISMLTLPEPSLLTSARTLCKLAVAPAPTCK